MGFIKDHHKSCGAFETRVKGENIDIYGIMIMSFVNILSVFASNEVSRKCT